MKLVGLDLSKAYGILHWDFGNTGDCPPEYVDVNSMANSE